jgi:hypothetical protein
MRPWKCFRGFSVSRQVRWRGFTRRLAEIQKRAILKKLAAKPYPSHMDVASVYFALGEKDHAFEWLGRGADERDPFIVRMTPNPTFENVRSDPRFQKVVARFNIPNN